MKKQTYKYGQDITEKRIVVKEANQPNCKTQNKVTVFKL